MEAEYVNFQSGVPERVALAYADGRLTEGMYGPRVMYTLADGRKMFLDPDVAAKINLMEIQPRQDFWVCKLKPAGKGQKTRWDVYLENPTPEAGETPLERDLRLSLNHAQRQNAQRQNTTQHHVSAATRTEKTTPDPAPEPPIRVQRTPAAQAAAQDLSQVSTLPAWAGTLVSYTNSVVDAYAQCLQHAAAHGLLVKAEDVRSLLTTVLINMSDAKKGAAGR